MKSTAPSRVALTAVSTVAWPLMRITGTDGACSRAARRNSTPSISGITTSERTASTSCEASFSSASRAEEAVIVA